MNGAVISFEQNIKLLGVIIDNRLNYSAHVTHTLSKAAKVFKNLCKFVRPTWGVHSENVTTIYRQVIEPIITYAAELWGDAAQRQGVIKRLRSFQRKFAIRAIRGFHTVSAVSTLALARFTPLHLKVREVCEIERVKRSGVCPEIPDDVCLERRVQPNQKLHPSIRHTINYTEATSQQEADAMASPTNIYTDGSKLDTGQVGAASIIYLPNGRQITRKHRLNSNCSVFQSKLFALTQVMQWIETHLKTDATICSDSLSSLKASHLLESLAKTLRHHNINFVWVKAHIGITGNEAADVLAKAAATQHTATAYEFPLSLAKKIIKHNIQQEWAAEYSAAVQGSTTRYWFPTLDDVFKYTAASKTSFQMTQILTGHGFHKQYLHRFKITSDALCPCDGRTTQTIDHLLSDCPKYATSRHQYHHFCSANNIQPLDLVSHDADLIIRFEELVVDIIGTLKAFNA